MSRMTATSIPALLEPIQERLDAATPGPWHIENDSEQDYEAGIPYSEWPQTLVGPANAYPSEWAKAHGETMRVDEISELTHADAEFIAAAPTDTARLLAAVKAVAALHKPYAICDPCECTDHPEEYEYIDCGEYNGCERTVTGWACGECCSDAMWFNTEECATNHRHTMNKDERCPTVSAVESALRGEA